MPRHARPKPIEPWKIPLFLIWCVIGYVIAAAIVGGG